MTDASCSFARRVRNVARTDRGSLSVLFAVLVVFFFSAIVLVAEGSRKLQHTAEAQDLASEAARAAAATLDRSALAAGELRLALNGDQARAEAERLVDLSLKPAEIVSFVVSTDESVVEVGVRVAGESWIPGFDVSGVGWHRAEVIDPLDHPPPDPVPGAETP